MKPLIYKTMNNIVKLSYKKKTESICIEREGLTVATIPVEYVYDLVSEGLLTTKTKRIGTARRAFQLRYSANIPTEELENGTMGELDA